MYAANESSTLVPLLFLLPTPALSADDADSTAVAIAVAVAADSPPMRLLKSSTGKGVMLAAWHLRM
jgi:hypothetical protein